MVKDAPTTGPVAAGVLVQEELGGAPDLKSAAAEIALELGQILALSPSDFIEYEGREYGA